MTNNREQIVIGAFNRLDKLHFLIKGESHIPARTATKLLNDTLLDFIREFPELHFKLTEEEHLNVKPYRPIGEIAI
jgi:hypothetical protein